MLSIAWIRMGSLVPDRPEVVIGSYVASPGLRRAGASRIARLVLRMMGLRTAGGKWTQPLNVPFGSLKRSSPCDTLVVGATGVVLATDVSDDDLPHNSRTVGETVGVRSST